MGWEFTKQMVEVEVQLFPGQVPLCTDVTVGCVSYQGLQIFDTAVQLPCSLWRHVMAHPFLPFTLRLLGTMLILVTEASN